MSRFGNAHGKNKITSAVLDKTKRRLASASSDGSIKVWNFSNGQHLGSCKYGNELDADEEEQSIPVPILKRKNCEVTSLNFAFEPSKDDDGDDEDENEKDAHIISVGWDKKVYIWQDTKEQEMD